MRCMDKSVYRYIKDLQDVQFGGTFPANPGSNISNTALGYFSARDWIRTDTKIVLVIFSYVNLLYYGFCRYETLEKSYETT